MLVREVPVHPHRMTFGNIKVHLPIGLPPGRAVQVILQILAINGGFYIPIKHTIICKLRDKRIYSQVDQLMAV